jgi:hypothetical protein
VKEASDQRGDQNSKRFLKKFYAKKKKKKLQVREKRYKFRERTQKKGKAPPKKKKGNTGAAELCTGAVAMADKTTAKDRQHR